MGTLVVAAGGGGDAITGSALAGRLGLIEPPVVMTYSWDRLMIDPLPGPRTADDFINLRQLGPDILEILPSTKPVGQAGSSLPRLAADLPSRVLLLDPAGGAVRMAAQISAAAAYFYADDIALIDVGGDARSRTVRIPVSAARLPTSSRSLRVSAPACPASSSSRHLASTANYPAELSSPDSTGSGPTSLPTSQP